MNDHTQTDDTNTTTNYNQHTSLITCVSILWFRSIMKIRIWNLIYHWQIQPLTRSHKINVQSMMFTVNYARIWIRIHLSYWSFIHIYIYIHFYVHSLYILYVLSFLYMCSLLFSSLLFSTLYSEQVNYVNGWVTPSEIVP